MPRQPVTPGTQQKISPSFSDGGFYATADKYLKLVERDCSQALAAMTQSERFLYRGLKDKRSPQGPIETPNAFRGAPHANRKSKDTFPALQIDVDNLLKKAGFAALRSNSIFVTSDPNQASEYGELYLVFPVDGFNMLWSPKYDDFYTGFLDRYGTLVTHLKHSKYIDREDFIDVMRHVSSMIRSIRELSSNLINHAGRDSEGLIELDNNARNAVADIYNIMNQDQFYRPLLTGHAPDPELTQMLFGYWETLKKANPRAANLLNGTNAPPGMEDRFDTIIHAISVLSKEHDVEEKAATEFMKETHGFKDGDLAGAIESQNEICIAGEYYAFKAALYGDTFQKKFSIPYHALSRY